MSGWWYLLALVIGALVGYSHGLIAGVLALAGLVLGGLIGFHLAAASSLGSPGWSLLGALVGAMVTDRERRAAVAHATACESAVGASLRNSEFPLRMLLPRSRSCICRPMPPEMDRTDLLLTGEEATRSIWLGVRITIGTLGVLAAFALLSGHDELALWPYLALVTAATVVVAVVARLPERLVAGARGAAVLYVWSLVDVVLIAVLVACSGGGRSPLFLLYALTCLFTASYPPVVQAVVGLVTAGSYLTVVALSGWHVSPAVLMVRMVTIGLLMLMAGWLAREKQQSAREASHRAELLEIVAAAARTLITLSPEEVLAGVTQAVTELGYESANISMIDEAADTYRVLHARGMPDEYVNATHPADMGMTGLARRAQKTIAVSDYHTLADAVPLLAASGFHSAIASPLWVDGQLAGVLIGGSKRHHQISTVDSEAFELLASIAGQGLESAHQFALLAEREAELERLNRRLVEDSRHDALTGLRNRRALAYDLPRLEAQHRERGREFAMVVCDVDHFKAYNDRLGRMAGDQALRAIAGVIRGQLRDGDVAYRFGGEELLIILTNTTPDEAAAAAERICAAVAAVAIAHPVGIGGVVTISVGVAAGTEDASRLLTEADAALYEAKRTGRNRIVFFSHPAARDGRPPEERRETRRWPDSAPIVKAVGCGPEAVLQVAAETIHLELGYEIVAVNLRDPCTDQAEVVLVLGDQDARAELHGLITPWPRLQALLACGQQRHGASWLPAGSDHAGVQTYEPALLKEDDPLAWDADDMLLLPVQNAAGEALALISVDQPLSARRPTDQDLAGLMNVCRQAGLALEQAQAAERAAGSDSPKRRLDVAMLPAETLDLRDPHTARHSRTVGEDARLTAYS